MENQILKSWKFHYGEIQGPWQKGFDDSKWSSVIVPHDWSVTMPFSKEYSSGTGYVAGGTAWYRTSFVLPEKLKGKKIFITFDGVYKNSQAWCNGYPLGKRPFGYATFQYDITDFVCFNENEEENIISVKVQHEDVGDSRWFTGSGIYRKVVVSTQEKVYAPWDGIFFTTPKINNEEATVEISNTIKNDTLEDVSVQVVNTLTGIDKATLVISNVIQVPANGQKSIVNIGILEKPNLWSMDSPCLYTLKTEIINNGITSVTDTRSVGIRYFSFHPDTGFYLNGKNLKIKGVCIHHDAGALGAAVYAEVWERRLRKLKEMGCNAIRMSHNPHMPELYSLCDEMGFMVMDEAFDEWEAFKNKWTKGHNVYPPAHYGYAEDFLEWHERDLSDLIKRNRNHPSIMMWSIGNEVDYPNDPYCHPLFKTMQGNNDKDKPKQEMIYSPDKPNTERLSVIANNLTKIVRKHDKTRIVLAASAFPELSTQLGFTDSFDIMGYNYKEHLYYEHHKQCPDMPIIGSENGHSYENWKAVRDNDYIAGQFLWTGIDYLGESRGEWPCHGTPAGLLDVAGFEKIDYYRRKSLWSSEPMVYLATRYQTEDEVLPSSLYRSWNYKAGEEIEVICYTNLEEAELFCNGISHGIAQKTPEKEYLLWTLPFSNGEIKVVGELAIDLLESTLPGVMVHLNAWDCTLPNRLVEQIEVQILDEKGRNCTFDSSMLSVEITNGTFLALESGDLFDSNDFNRNRRAYLGRGIIYVQKKNPEDTVTIIVKSPNLKTGKIVV